MQRIDGPRRDVPRRNRTARCGDACNAPTGRVLCCTFSRRVHQHRRLLAFTGGRVSQYSASGRPYRRLQAQVFNEETHCWLCHGYVNQRLPANDDMARSLDHVTPVSRGGNPLARTNARLAHRRCNSSRKAGPHNPQSRPWLGGG